MDTHNNPDLLKALKNAAGYLEGLRVWASSDAINMPELAAQVRNELALIRAAIAQAT